ncbi:hypothetical protein SAMN04488038_101374 [Solimonas aquatica]|uniref:Lysylphosphatidylglycerol synthase TM region n=1 Tax=Solimonas aquatica TaxID=489703 RepID=A0A1H9AE12_9GAMM|nr:lysylphosphatidylglycerol synthase domain-containing protein [Solimonas aquatica]SEP75012.1 hypothetical protein SAMN04488038_101374 [Solimonas aquatica]
MLPSPSQSLPPGSFAKLAARLRGRDGRRLQLLLVLVFWAVLIAVLAQGMPQLDLRAILQGLRSHDARGIALVLLYTASSYTAAGCYDLLARRHAGSRLGAARTVAINLVAYAASLNIGAVLGGWGLRLRLYTRHGLKPAQVAQIIALAMLANWSGFLLLSGGLLLLAPVWGGAQTLARVGGAMLLLLLLLLFQGAGQRRRSLRLLRHGPQLRLPRFPGRRDALLLAMAATASWLCMACALRILLPADLQFAEVLKLLLISSIAALILRVPGGLGVMEGSFAYLLAGRYAPAGIIAAVLLFRALYHLLPLLLALPLYLTLELQSRPARGHEF